MKMEVGEHLVDVLVRQILNLIFKFEKRYHLDMVEQRS